MRNRKSIYHHKGLFSKRNPGLRPIAERRKAMDMLIKEALVAYRAKLESEIDPHKILVKAVDTANGDGKINTNDLSAALGRARTIGTIDQMLKKKGS